MRPSKSAKPDSTQAAIAALEGMGFRLTHGTNRIDCESTLGAYLKLNAAVPELIKSCKRSGEMLDEVYNSKDTDFCGGTANSLTDALNGRLDMEPYRKAKAEFAKTALHKKLVTVMAEMGTRRTRRLSEHDGEWDYDRRWELNPFQTTARKSAPIRIVEINAELAIHGGVDSSEVDRYGTTIWALSQLIEDAGIQTRIVYEVSLEALDSNARLKSKTRLILKEPDQYLSPSLLAASFSCNFKRRLNFAHSCVLAEAAGMRVNSGMGTPIYRRTPIEFRDGKLLLSLEAANPAHTKQVQREIMKSIGQKTA